MNQLVLEKILENSMNDIENIELPNFVRKDGLFCNGYENNLFLCSKDNNVSKCNKSECLINTNSRININYDDLIIKDDKNISNKIDTINLKVNELEQIMFKNLNNYNEMNIEQKKLYSNNSKISKKLKNNFKNKKKKFDLENNKFRIKYDTIDDLNNRIKNHKNTIKKYLNILKYLIPILVIFIILFFIFQNMSLF